MNLEKQNNRVKEELITLYKMLETKLEQMNGVSERYEIRRVDEQMPHVKNILRSYFDFDQTGNNKEIEVACKIADKY